MGKGGNNGPFYLVLRGPARLAGATPVGFSAARRGGVIDLFEDDLLSLDLGGDSKRTS
jgi:hypothetical protein